MAKPSTEAIEPSPGECRNGWNKETLAAYLAQRAAEKQAFAKLMAEQKPRAAVSETTQRFNPHDW